MYQILGAAVAIWLVFACIDQCNGHPDHHAQRPSGQSVAQVRPAATDTSAEAPPVRAASSVRRANSGDPAALIAAVSREFNVPAGALYGVWMKESSGLRSGWGEGQGWILSVEQTASGSECQQHYGSARCLRLWNALGTICGQRRADGSAVCDPRQVRASYALAMGPMQLLPTLLVVEKDGGYAWGDHAVDYDGDGVVDPHDLGDAMASAAKLIRRFYETERDWPRAINRYYGSQTEGYFEGTTEVLGVVDHWRRWCEMPGNCRAEAAALASR